MNPLKSELSNIAGIALSGIAMTCCGAFLPPGAAIKVVESLAPNFAHQFLSGVDYERFKDFLIKPHPGSLNHDLNQLMKDALLQAFHHVETAYIDKLKNETEFTHWQKIIDRPFKEIKQAFKLLRKNLLREEEYQKEFEESLNEDEKIDFNLSAWLTDGSWSALPKLTDVLFKFPEIENEEKWQDLKNYFEENLPWIYDLSFKQALKDERNLRAYKAYQMFILEMIVKQNADTHLQLDEIKVTLLALEHNLLTQNQITLSNSLEKDIQQLRKDLSNFIIKVLSAIRELEKRIIHKVEEKGNEIIDKVDDKGNEIIERLNLTKPIIERHLTEPPFHPEVFLGRQDDIEDIRRILFEENHLLLLVSGTGGVGKTSLASRYYHKFQNHYSHMAWVLKETSIGDALLALAPKLHIEFDPLYSKKERLDILITRLFNLNKTCLLVIDNANDYEDLNTYYQLLNRCSNFHILLTTRITEFEQAHTKKIGSLPKETALELFQKYYPIVAKEEEVYFEKLYLAVNGNTLVLELIAKQLREANLIRDKYSLPDLINDLQTKGILQLQFSSDVRLYYQKYKNAKPEEVITALYDLEELSDEERKLSSMLAVLPPEGIQIKTLDILLPEVSWWEKALRKLALKGWVDYNKMDKEVKVSPVIQEIVRRKNDKRLQDDVSVLTNSLSDELAYEGWSHRVHGENPNFNETNLFAYYTSSILTFCLNEDYTTLLLTKRLMRHYILYLRDDKAKIWFERLNSILERRNTKDYQFLYAESLSLLGDVYKSEGRMNQALDCYQKDFEISLSLNESYPEQVYYINNLGIAYSKLGDVYASEGKMNKALDCFQKYLEIMSSLYESYPEQVSYKNGLGIAYERLGDVFTSEGKMNQALNCYQKYLEIMSSLYESYPEQVYYKNNLGIANSRLGDVYKSEGKMSQALNCYQKYLEIMSSFHESYPEQVYYINNLGIAYSKLGDVYKSEGKMNKALDCFQKYLEIMSSLYESYPEQVSYKNNLGVAYERLGDLYQSEERMNQALDCFQKCFEIFKSLHETYPKQVSYKNGLGIVYERLGNLYESKDLMNEALINYQKCYELSKTLFESNPELVEYQYGFCTASIWYGDTMERLGKNEESKIIFIEAFTIYEDLINKVPENVIYKRNYYWLKGKLGKY
ncbi:tetratricopeptide repeat protein [Emticicia sp. BO119]|uniref:tetratricopeptide repeat protein n=1 Tax=Emticicia sp. BO119 TaxID=2757768 RepID=UPI0015F0E9D0|nr:tetratricopeptide repeat protein [Emticicia sp. BO119]MBA4852906.1 tetratricopeptide repeat protein [Emticicia sp. BO119]